MNALFGKKRRVQEGSGQLILKFGTLLFILVGEGLELGSFMLSL
jgi:hypothetical protein